MLRSNLELRLAFWVIFSGGVTQGMFTLSPLRNDINFRSYERERYALEIDAQGTYVRSD